jgi:succinyl-CoA synthetase beta subunit
MYIHEYQAKQILRDNGIPSPPGIVATSVDEALQAARDLGGESWAVKAQVYSGGRGAGRFRGQDASEGGVRIVDSLDGVRRSSEDMLGQTLITDQTGSVGRKVERLYIETGCDIERELYFAMLVDRSSSQLLLVVSAQGGQNIEKVAADDPEAILRVPIDLLEGPSHDAVGEAIAGFELPGDQASQVLDVVDAMFRLFISLDCSLIEINPLAITRQGEVLALDSVMTFDNNALFRHPEIRDLRDEKQLPPGMLRAYVHGINYVKLDGDIGYMANGAGLALATLDAIKYAGGNPANFLDVPPVVQQSIVRDAFKLLTSDPDVKAILVNIFGGGIMRCDTVADAILTALVDEPLRVPLVVRLMGVDAELGLARLKNSGHGILLANSLTEVANLAVDAAQKGRMDGRKSWWERANSLFGGRN